VVYHDPIGGKETRKFIREHEWYFKKITCAYGSPVAACAVSAATLLAIDSWVLLGYSPSTGRSPSYVWFVGALLIWIRAGAPFLVPLCTVVPIDTVVLTGYSRGTHGVLTGHSRGTQASVRLGSAVM
jgi:hypothetical protein